MHRADYGPELDKHAVAGGLDDPPAVLNDNGLNCAPMHAQPPRRPLLICPHQPRIAHQVGGQDRCEPTLDPLSAQGALPNTTSARQARDAASQNEFALPAELESTACWF